MVSRLDSQAVWAVAVSGSCALLALLSACAPSSGQEKSPALGAERQAMINGVDTRRDYYELGESETKLKRLMEKSTVVLMWQKDAQNALTAQSFNVGESLAGKLHPYGDCSGVRFADDPANGWCSGTLVSDDLILTAGHCVYPGNCDGIDHPDDVTKMEVAFVFEYYRIGQTTMHPISERDVFHCTEIVRGCDSVRYGSGLCNKDSDYALVRVARVGGQTPGQSGFAPANIRQSYNGLTAGEELTLIGSPKGIPLKAAEGIVLDPDYQWYNLDHILIGPVGFPDAFFAANTAYFHGNSGSAWYDSNFEIIGLLTSAPPSDQYNNITVDYTLHPECTETVDDEPSLNVYIQLVMIDYCLWSKTSPYPAHPDPYNDPLCAGVVDSDRDKIPNIVDPCPCGGNDEDGDGVCSACGAALPGPCSALCSIVAVDGCPTHRDSGRNCNFEAERVANSLNSSVKIKDDVCDPAPCYQANPVIEERSSTTLADNMAVSVIRTEADSFRVEYDKVVKAGSVLAADAADYRACVPASTNAGDCLYPEYIRKKFARDPFSWTNPWRGVTTNATGPEVPDRSQDAVSFSIEYNRIWDAKGDFKRWGVERGDVVYWTHVDTKQNSGSPTNTPPRDSAMLRTPMELA